MKINYLFAFFISVLSLVSCSSESSSSSSSSTNSTNTGSFSIDGSAANSLTTTAQISENLIAITSTASNGDEIELQFNKFGDLVTVYLDKADGTRYMSYKYYAAHYFSFNLVSFDESTRRAKVNYTGKVYLDDESLNSEFKTLNGSFDVVCVPRTPLVAGLSFSCKINGNQWNQTTGWYQESGSDATNRWISDDEFMIIGSVNRATAVGTYSFVPGNTNRFQLAKFDTTDLYYKEFNCTGSYTVTSNQLYNEFLGQRIVTGTFSFTAVNPEDTSEQIVVSNGTFKKIF